MARYIYFGIDGDDRPLAAIRSSSYVPKAKIPKALRLATFERDGFTCRHCGATDRLSADHIHPESLGGPTTLENLQTLCKSCNSRKGARVE